MPLKQRQCWLYNLLNWNLHRTRLFLGSVQSENQKYKLPIAVHLFPFILYMCVCAIELNAIADFRPVCANIPINYYLHNGQWTESRQKKIVTQKIDCLHIFLGLLYSKLKRFEMFFFTLTHLKYILSRWTL